MGYHRKVKESIHKRHRLKKSPPLGQRGANYSQCLKKTPYSSLRHAERVAENVKLKRDDILRVYLCPKCEMYHLTKGVKRHAADAY